MSFQPSFRPRFQLEPFTEEWTHEAKTLFKSHFDEVAVFQEVAPSLGIKTYLEAQKGGLLRLYTMRDDKRLVGYMAFIVSKHPHYGVLQALEDAIYIHPSSRKGLIGLKFIKYADEELKKEGVVIVYRHLGVMRDTSKLFERLDYVKVEEIYAKKFED